VIDLGSGDGRTVIAAAKRGARAHGIEYNPDMVALSQKRRRRRRRGQGHVREGRSLRDRLLEGHRHHDVPAALHQRETAAEAAGAEPGTRIVSNSFTMEDWEADQSATVEEGLHQLVHGAALDATVLNASGYVTARRRATVSSKITGKIVEVNVEEGMAVREGQVLARLDDATPGRRWRSSRRSRERPRRAPSTEIEVRLAEAGCR
jgi:biotin carboxyl carrier protein